MATIFVILYWEPSVDREVTDTPSWPLKTFHDEEEARGHLLAIAAELERVRAAWTASGIGYERIVDGPTYEDGKGVALTLDNDETWTFETTLPSIAPCLTFFPEENTVVDRLNQRGPPSARLNVPDQIDTVTLESDDQHVLAAWTFVEVEAPR